MAFSGLSSNELFTADQIQRDIAALMVALSPKETPVLDWLGDSNRVATSIKHEWIPDHLFPNFVVASTAINSATANTAFQVNGLGNAVNVGQLLENQSAAPEVMQVVSIVGANSIVVTRNYDGSGIGSLAPGQQLYVRESAGVEGADHSGADTRRICDPVSNTVGLFRMELAQSNTTTNVNQIGRTKWEDRKAKGLIDVMHQIEKGVIRGVLNASNSLGTTTATRTMKGLRSFLTTISSTVTASSFNANPHLYIGNVWQQAFANGASPDTETWAIIAGSTYFNDISNLNDTKVSDSQQAEEFKRVVRRYTGAYGTAEVFLSRVLPATELLLIARERLAVVPLQGRSVKFEDMAKTGDNQKGLFTGEYTLEVHHENAMARIKS